VKSITQKSITFLLKHSLLFILITTLLFLISVILLPKIQIDNSVDVFFNKESNSYINFQEWKEEFGSDEIVMVAFSDKDIFTRENLELIEFLTDKFENLKWVNNVTSLTNVNNIIGDENDFIVEHLIETIPSSYLIFFLTSSIVSSYLCQT